MPFQDAEISGVSRLVEFRSRQGRFDRVCTGILLALKLDIFAVRNLEGLVVGLPLGHRNTERIALDGREKLFLGNELRRPIRRSCQIVPCASLEQCHFQLRPFHSATGHHAPQGGHDAQSDENCRGSPDNWGGRLTAGRPTNDLGQIKPAFCLNSRAFAFAVSAAASPSSSTVQKASIARSPSGTHLCNHSLIVLRLL